MIDDYRIWEVVVKYDDISWNTKGEGNNRGIF